jgi:hypothetical protein
MFFDNETYEQATYGEPKVAPADTSHLVEEIEVSYFTKQGEEITVTVAVPFKYNWDRNGYEFKDYSVTDMMKGWEKATGKKAYHSWQI